MAKPYFNIADEAFFTFLHGLDRAIRASELPHMFVGGVAVQAYIAQFLCKSYNTSLLELNTSGDIDSILHRTDNIDVAFGLPEDEEYKAQIKSLKEHYDEASRRCNRAREILSKPKEIKILNKSEEERKDLMKQKIAELEQRREVLRDRKINAIADMFYDTLLESLAENSDIVTVNEIRRGTTRSQYILGIDGMQQRDKPVTVNIYRGLRDVIRFGSLRDLNDSFYSEAFSRAQDAEIIYTSNRMFTLRITNTEDLLVTKIKLDKERHFEDASEVASFARKAGHAINYHAIWNSPLRLRYDTPMELERALVHA